MNLDAFIALLKLQRLIRARKWHAAYLAAEVLDQITGIRT
jgi:hypothetical protein